MKFFSISGLLVSIILLSTGWSCQPTKTPNQTNAVQGIGVSRDSFINQFTSDTFYFTAGSNIEGKENYVAQDEVIVMQLIGPADNLQSANVSFILPVGDAVMEDMITRVYNFISLIDSNLASGEWLSDQMTVVAESGGVEDYDTTIRRDGNIFSFTYTANDGIYQVSVYPNEKLFTQDK